MLTRRWQQRDLERTRTWQEHDLEKERQANTRTWALDGLKQALIDHINLSFKIGRVCTDAFLARARNDAAVLDQAFSRATNLHIEYMDLMVYLRLLSTPRIVARAEELHRSLDHLLDLTFHEEITRVGTRPFTKGGNGPYELTAERAKAQCMERREALINEARVYFNLPADAVINRGV